MRTWTIRNKDEIPRPYTDEELKVVGVSREDFVCKQGFLQRIRSADVVPLLPLFQRSVPPLFGAMPTDVQSSNLHQGHPNLLYFSSDIPNQNHKGTGIGRLLKWSRTGVVILLLGGFLYNQTAYGSTGLVSFSRLVDQEKVSPVAFLQTDDTYPTSLSGQLVDNGINSTKAYHINYKGVDRVSFYSATQSLREEKDYVIYDYVPNSGEKEFRLKLEKPKVTKACRGGLWMLYIVKV